MECKRCAITTVWHTLIKNKCNLCGSLYFHIPRGVPKDNYCTNKCFETKLIEDKEWRNEIN